MGIRQNVGGRRMNNEDAIEQFQNAVDLIKQNGKDWLDERDIPMLEMAICALKNKQTDGDLTLPPLESGGKIDKQKYYPIGSDYSKEKVGTEMTDGDLISRIEKLHTIESTDGQEYYQAYDVLRTIKEYMETAEPKTAEWIETFTGNGQLRYKCSNCNATGYLYKREICPNCVAKMEGDTE